MKETWRSTLKIAIPTGIVVGLLATWAGSAIDLSPPMLPQNTTGQTYDSLAVAQEKLRQAEIQLKLLEQMIKEKEEVLENETR